jgi:hypothetical protein
MKIVLASNNQGKLAELKAMLAPLGLTLVSQAELGLPEAEEPFRTFVENALAKARQAPASAACPRWQTMPACAWMPSAACPASIPRSTPPSLAMPRATTTTSRPCLSKWPA